MTVPSGVHREIPIALTIAGSDSGGNAGIQADLKTFAAHNVFGSSAITATTAQNPEGVISIETSSESHLGNQILQVLDYFPVNAIKIGMLANAGLVRKVTSVLANHPSKPIVVLDPVMVSTSGSLLLEQEAITALIEGLIPLTTVVTPNLDEARVMLGWDRITHDNLIEAAAELAKRCQTSVFLKGGHLPGSQLMDVWHSPNGEHRTWNSQRIEEVDTHGSGCTLAAAIAANLARGQSLVPAIDQARNYLLDGLRHPLELNHRLYINHFPPRQKE